MKQSGGLLSVMGNKNAGQTTMTTSSLTEQTVSSLNTVEKQENAEAEKKQAGNDFNFAKEFNRTTMSRTDLTSFIQKRYESIWTKTEEF